MSALKVCPQCGTEYPANARFCEIDGTALRSASGGGDLEGSIIADRYLVLKKLGEGGMGQVYLAEHVKMGRRSALKVMHPGLVKDVDSVSRFNREAANASRISHPNVAAVYDFGETADGLIYLAMELVDGPTLTKLIEQQGALPPKRAAEIGRQTADALAAAHDLGIVHRDLKPDNIMIARTRDGGDLVKVVDFGIAKTAGVGVGAQKVTKTGLVVGTPEYMSPEQLAGDTLDGRSDIYALGLVTFNMLTGVLPFPSDSAQEVMIMRLTERPRPLSEMKPDVAWPAELQAVMDKALERDLSLRYATASEFGRDLIRAVDRMPDTISMEMGTQMLDAVPPTRVSAGAPITAGGVAVPRNAKRSGPRRYVPVIAAAVVLVAAAAIATPMLLRKPASADPVRTSSAAPSVSTPGANPTTQAGTAVTGAPVAGRAAAESLAAPAGGNRARGTQVEPFSRVASKAASNGDGAAGNDVEGTLSKLETDAKDSTRARGVIARLTAMSDRLTTDDEKARADFVRFRAYGTLNDSTRACESIKEAARDAKNERMKSRYADLVNAGC